MTEQARQEALAPDSPFAPINAQDKCYMKHDICYGEARMGCRKEPCPDGCEQKKFSTCDDELRRCLISIGLQGSALDEAARIGAIGAFTVQPATQKSR